MSAKPAIRNWVLSFSSFSIIWRMSRNLILGENLHHISLTTVDAVLRLKDIKLEILQVSQTWPSHKTVEENVARWASQGSEWPIGHLWPFPWLILLQFYLGIKSCVGSCVFYCFLPWIPREGYQSSLDNSTVLPTALRKATSITLWLFSCFHFVIGTLLSLEIMTLRMNSSSWFHRWGGWVSWEHMVLTGQT